MADSFDLEIKSLEVKQQHNIAKLKDAFRRDLLQNNHFYVFTITVLIALSTIGVAIFSTDTEFRKYYCGITIPLITTYMGYAIGGRRGSSTTN